MLCPTLFTPLCRFTLEDLVSRTANETPGVIFGRSRHSYRRWLELWLKVTGLGGSAHAHAHAHACRLYLVKSGGRSRSLGLGFMESKSLTLYGFMGV